MRVLISNDDGIHAPGLKTLVRTFKKWADVCVVAPETEQSASSHSLTLHRPLRIRQLEKNSYAISGTPTDCIMLAVHQILESKPDLIISGINRGANLGDDVHYSGTVSGAMEGAILDITSVAVSLAIFDDKRPHYTAAADFALGFAKKIIKKNLPPGLLFNINVPNLSEDAIEGCEITALGKRHYGGVIVEKTDPRGRAYYWIGGDQKSFYQKKGTDCMAIQNKKISITPLKKNLTYSAYLSKMRKWSL
jgi:5'-nucleotidase